MRIGPFEFYFRPGNTTIGAEALEFLNSDPRVAAGVAKMARSEVKNYLAELAEENDLPFSDPAAFLAQVRTRLAAAMLVELANKKTGITLEELERLHAEADPTFNPFSFGGYANHPEQKEYDSSNPFEVIRNVRLAPMPGDEFEDDEPGVRRGEG